VGLTNLHPELQELAAWCSLNLGVTAALSLTDVQARSGRADLGMWHHFSD